MSGAWQNQARCRQEDPDDMQPEVTTQARMDAALAVCSGCPVFEQCQREAEAQGTVWIGGHAVEAAYGVWAGRWWGPAPEMSEAECEWCGEPMEVGDRSKGGRRRRFCSKTHATYAARDRGKMLA